MKIVIIIPTYNEVDNIGRLIDALHREFADLSYDMHILVVDDNSPDGTANQVRERMPKCPMVHLITGTKNGLGAAYIRGMRYALDELGADAVFEMDADFSHKPEDVPRMIAALEGGADFVIGSRYVTGGSIPREWGMPRRLISYVGNIVARYVAGLYRVRDCTAGFRAADRSGEDVSASLTRDPNTGRRIAMLLFPAPSSQSESKGICPFMPGFLSARVVTR